MDSYVLQFLDKSRNCRDFTALSGLLQDVFQQMGFPRWAYQTESTPKFKAPETVIIHNFPHKWVEYYMTNKCSETDPVITMGGSLTKPFQWSKLMEGLELPKSLKDYSSQAADFGLRDGLGIPLICPKGKPSMMSMADDDKDISKKLAVHQSDIIAIAFAFHAIAKDILRESPCKPEEDILTAREKECLLWTMKGKGMWEISQILTLTERTVEFHLINAKNKLGVSNKYHAIVKAIIEGHITP